MTSPKPSTLSRRSLLRLGGAAAAAAPLAACAGAPGESSSSDKFTVYWNSGHAYEAYDKVIAEFEEKHGISVNFQKFQWPDLRTRLLSDFKSGSVPDLVESTGGWVREFAVTGDALSLKSYIEKDGKKMGYPDDWQPASLERQKYKDEFYGVQLHLTCTMLMNNKKMLADANVKPPTTWDELVEVAKELTTKDVHGIALNQDYTYSLPWLMQNGVRYYDPDTKDFLTPHDATIEALEFQADLIHKHKVSPVPVPGTDYSGPQKLLSSNRAAMILSGPWDLKPIAETSPDLDLGIAPALKGKQQATIQAGASMFVPAKAKSPDLSWDFIKRITDVDVELAATKESDMLMPRLSWAKKPHVEKNELFSAFSDGFEYAIDSSEDISLTGKAGEVSELYKTLYESVVMEKADAKKSLDTFLKAAKKTLG